MESQSGRPKKRKPIVVIEVSDDDDFASPPPPPSGASQNSVVGRKSGSRSRNNMSAASTSSFFNTSSFAKEKKQTDSQALFCDQFVPTKIDELAVHNDKVKKLRSWLEDQKKSGSVLVLTGPPGSGKSIALAVLARSIGISLQEWEFEENFTLAGDFLLSRDNEFESFFKFIRGNAAGFDDLPVIKVIDTLPISCFRDPHKFRERLLSALAYSRQSIVFCLSDVDSCYEVSPQRIFSQTFLKGSNLHTLSFNPIAKTFLLKALKRLVTKMSLKADSKVLDQIASSCNGDLRAAINSLQFSMDSTGRLSEVDPSLEATLNDEMFRMIGHLLYANRLETAEERPNWLRETLDRPPPDKDINAVLAMSRVEASDLLLYLHDQEPLFSPSISNTAKFLENISLVDSMASRWDVRERSKEYVSQIGARTTYFYNYGKKTEKRKFHSLTSPKWSKLDREVRTLLTDLKDNVPFARLGSTTMIMQLAALSRIRLSVSSEQMDVVSYVTRPLDFPWILGRQQWRMKMTLGGSLARRNLVESSKSALDPVLSESDSEDDVLDNFDIEDSDEEAPPEPEQDSFDEDVEFITINPK